MQNISSHKMNINFFQTPIDYLKGVGPNRADLLKKELGIYTFQDLVNLFPNRYLDRTQFYKIDQLQRTSADVQIIGKLTNIKTVAQKRGKRLVANFQDNSGKMELVWFKGHKWIRENLKLNVAYVVFGKTNWFNGVFSMPHPEMELLTEYEKNLRPVMQPVYPSTEKLIARGLSNRVVNSMMQHLFLETKNSIAETLPNNILESLKLLAEKEVFGEDYYYWKLFQSAEQLQSLSEEGKGEALNNPKASSLTFYEKGAWALHILREKIGDSIFKKAIKNYIEKYQYKNVRIDDFIIEVEHAYGKELIEYKKDWILQSAFKSEQAYQSLIKSNFINEYFKISALRETPITLKMAEFGKALIFPDDFIGQEIVYQLINEPLSLTLPLYKKAFNSNNVFVRQAIALSMDKIPKELKSYYESLLYDNSYLTQESALGNLWVNFPENKSKYLDKMDGIIGFRDKNIRQFWLFLALITEDYQTVKKEYFLEELIEYTSSKYAYNIREKALEYIGYLNVWNRDSLVNLIDASQHHYWRFRDFSRNIFKGLLEDEKYREQFMLLKQELDTDSLKFLKMMLNEK